MDKQKINKLAEAKWLEYRDNVHKTVWYKFNDFEKKLFIDGFKIGLSISNLMKKGARKS
jgi:hypothetical protein